MLSGTDVRIFRKSLGQNQTDFAAHLGLAQSTLSLIEGGKIPVSDEHVDLLLEKFPGSKHKPSFSKFLEGIQEAGAESQAALTSAAGRYSTLAVWAWENGFDLSRVPRPDQAVDLVTIQAPAGQTIALKMTRGSAHWKAGEVFVFEEGHREQVGDDEICLVQVRTAKGVGSRTMIARARVARAERGKSIQFEPVSPTGPVFGKEDQNIIIVLPAIYRGRRLK